MAGRSRNGRGNRPLDQLAATIEGEIIPRLLLAHRLGPRAASEAPDEDAVGPTEVAEFTRLVLQHDAPVARAYLRGLQGQGVDQETLLLDLLAPAARTLGDLWSADLADFTQVTVAMGRLQEILHDLCPGLAGEVRPRRGTAAQRAVLAPAPGEQHTLGVALVTEFMRRSGWDVVGGPAIAAGALPEIVSAQWFSVAGLSLSSARRLPELADGIRAIRAASRNPRIAVLVGGTVFIDNPGLVTEVGADATAWDARQAAAIASHLVAPQERN